MMEHSIEVPIPTDSDGFVLLKCPLCGEHFKLRPSDYEREDVLQIWCPSCGLISESYLTDDVIELAITKLQNTVMDSLHKDIKKLERNTKHKNVQFKAGRKPRQVKEDPIMYSIDNMETVYYPCCKKEAKVDSLYKSIGSYCPFCGVRNG